MGAAGVGEQGSSSSHGSICGDLMGADLAALHGDRRRARACYVGFGRRGSFIERDLASGGGGRGWRERFFIFTLVSFVAT